MAERWRSTLGPPTALLGRLRWSFLVFTLFFVLTFQPQIFSSDRPAVVQVAAAVALLGLGAWYLRCYRRGCFPFLGMVFEAAAFAVVALGPDDPYKALGLMYISVNFRALYGTWRQVVVATVLTVATFSAAVYFTPALFAGTPKQFPLLMQSIPGVPVLMAITHLVAIASERFERATAREHVLSHSGMAIATAPDRRAVVDQALAALRTLAGEVPLHGAQVVLGEDAGAPPPEGASRLTLPLRTRDHELGRLDVDSPSGLPMEVRDAVEALAAQLSLGLENASLTERLRHRATHDALTGLANRSLLDECLQDALVVAAPGELAVLLLDLDGFKAVNDTLGHGAGDVLLSAVAERLRELAAESDLVARLGGDEFVVLLRGRHAGRRAPELARRAAEALSRPVQLAGGPVAVGASVGVAVAGEGCTADQLLHEADSAMYRVKHGRARVARVG